MLTRDQLIDNSLPYLGLTKVGDPAVAAKTQPVVAIVRDNVDDVLRECVQAHEWWEFMTSSANSNLCPTDRYAATNTTRDKIALEVPAAGAWEYRRVTTSQTTLPAITLSGDVQWVYIADIV